MKKRKVKIMKPIVKNNEELLFIYDAEMCNPNGDPDNENKPRMDYATSTNIVTDVRLKRYIRDYLEQFKKLDIYIANPEGIVLNATDRLKFWQWRSKNSSEEIDREKIEEIRKAKLEKLEETQILDAFIDTRMFGATIPIKGGDSIKFIGPIQFNWGKSLNEAEIVDSSGITSHLSSETGAVGTMGTDYRVYYSLIAFHGIISANRAMETKLTEEDIKLFDESLLKSIPLLATRSKIGQYPRMYFRIVYKTNDSFIGDFRKHITLKNNKGLRSIGDIDLDLSKFWALLENNLDKIEAIYHWIDPKIKHTKVPDKINSLFRDFDLVYL